MAKSLTMSQTQIWSKILALKSDSTESRSSKASRNCKTTTTRERHQPQQSSMSRSLKPPGRKLPNKAKLSRIRMKTSSNNHLVIAQAQTNLRASSSHQFQPTRTKWALIKTWPKAKSSSSMSRQTSSWTSNRSMLDRAICHRPTCSLSSRCKPTIETLKTSSNSNQQLQPLPLATCQWRSIPTHQSCRDMARTLLISSSSSQLVRLAKTQIQIKRWYSITNLQMSIFTPNFM